MDGVETTEHYSGSGTYFGSGTNAGTRDSTEDLLKKIKIVKYLTRSRGSAKYGEDMGHIKKLEDGTYNLTSNGWKYWKDTIGDRE